MSQDCLQTGPISLWARPGSMSIHESQSLLFEKTAVFVKTFIQFLTPVLHQHFRHSPADWSALWHAMTSKTGLHSG